MHITAEEQSCQRQHIQLAALRYYFDRRTLEAHLCSLVEAAHVGKFQGMLAGAPFFAVLTRQAEDQVSDHCDRWELDARRVETDLPPMAELRQLTIPAASTCIGHDRSRWIVIALAVLAISAALLTLEISKQCLKGSWKQLNKIDHCECGVQASRAIATTSNLRSIYACSPMTSNFFVQRSESSPNSARRVQTSHRAMTAANVTHRRA